jgi:hypothetical protein
MYYANYLIIILQRNVAQPMDLLSTIIPYLVIALMFGIPTYFVAKAKGKKSIWYLIAGLIPLVCVILIIVLLVQPSKEDRDKLDRIDKLEKEVARLNEERSKNITDDRGKTKE